MENPCGNKSNEHAYVLLSHVYPWFKILNANCCSLISYHFTQLGKHKDYESHLCK